jgi:hypothetical protein
LPKLAAEREQIGFGRQRVAEDFDGLLGYHPLLLHDAKAGDVVVVAQPGYVKAFSLATGEPAWPGAEEPGAVFPPPAKGTPTRRSRATCRGGGRMWACLASR